MIARNMAEVCEALTADLWKKSVDSENYRKMWVSYGLQNKKKQLYGFVVTIFPYGNGLYEQNFIYRVFVNLEKTRTSPQYSEKYYLVKNYDEVLNQIREVVESNKYSSHD